MLDVFNCYAVSCKDDQSGPMKCCPSYPVSEIGSNLEGALLVLVWFVEFSVYVQLSRFRRQCRGTYEDLYAPSQVALRYVTLDLKG